MKRFKGMKGIIILAVLVALLIGYYYYIANKIKPDEEETVKTTRTQEMLLRDLENNYPPTPKEVVRLYSDIAQCFYGEEYSEEELRSLAEMFYQLFDEELAEANPFDLFYANLVNDISDYKEKNYVITAYSTSSSVAIENEKFTKDGYTCTRVYCYYTMRYGTTITTLSEVFVLRKDSSGFWRIYGWDTVEES